jgi:hypothetical protein
VSVVSRAPIVLRHRRGPRVKTLEAGKYTIVVHDRSTRDNLHLRGHRVDRKTGIRFTGSAAWRVRLAAGHVFRYGSDRQSRLGGAFRTVATPVQPTVFATGLLGPRGLKFGPDGRLYVAEAGSAGSSSTAGQCTQTNPPFTSGSTARISRLSPRGVRATVAAGLPSSRSSLGLTIGVADVAFIGRRLYAVIAGAGCSHGVADFPNGIIRVNRKGSWRLVSNLSAFWQANPTVNPDHVDFHPDGFPYSMVAVGGNLYVLEGNHGELDRITPSGKVRRVIDTSASQGHTNTNALAYRRKFYVGALGTFPVVPGTQKILRVSRSGDLDGIIEGLTAVLGLAFDKRGRLYALQTTTASGAPLPDAGSVVRLGRSGRQKLIVTGLNLPTAMTFGPDGALYISNNGWQAPMTEARDGQILRVEVPD